MIQSYPVSFIEKSRDMMMSWFCVGYFTHAAMTNDQREVLFQSQKEDKAAELVDYAKTLYDQQDERLKRRFRLAKPLSNQAALKLEFANDSRLIGIPEGADQIRSYHPWGLLMDEAAFQPEGIVDRDNHLRDCAKYIVLSLPRPCEVPVEITREKIVDDAFKNGTYPTLGVQLARFQEQDRRNSEPISYRPRFPMGIDDMYR